MNLNESFNYLAIQEIFLRTTNAIKLKILQSLADDISSTLYYRTVMNFIGKYNLTKLSSQKNHIIDENSDGNDMIVDFPDSDVEIFRSWFRSLAMVSRIEIINALLKMAGPEIRSNLVKTITVRRCCETSNGEDSGEKLEKETSSESMPYRPSELSTFYEQWDERIKQFPLRIEEKINKDRWQAKRAEAIDSIQLLPIEVVTKILLYLDEASRSCLKSVNDYWLVTVSDFQAHIQERSLVQKHKNTDVVNMKEACYHRMNKRRITNTTCNKSLHKALQREKFNLDEYIWQ